MPETKKRKSNTSTEVKSRYNKKTYDRITVSVKKELALAFKEKCASLNVSQAKILTDAITAFVKE